MATKHLKPYGFYPAPPTMAELEKRELDERLQRAAVEYDRTLRTDVTRGEFEELETRITYLESRLGFSLRDV